MAHAIALPPLSLLWNAISWFASFREALQPELTSALNLCRSCVCTSPRGRLRMGPCASRFLIIGYLPIIGLVLLAQKASIVFTQFKAFRMIGSRKKRGSSRLMRVAPKSATRPLFPPVRCVCVPPTPPLPPLEFKFSRLNLDFAPLFCLVLCTRQKWAGLGLFNIQHLCVCVCVCECVCVCCMLSVLCSRPT